MARGHQRRSRESRATENFGVRITLWVIKKGFQEEVLGFQGASDATQLLSYFYHHLNSQHLWVQRDIRWALTLQIGEWGHFARSSITGLVPLRHRNSTNVLE